MPKQPRMFERNPFHPVYKNDRDMQSRIIVAKLRQELLNGRKPTLQQQTMMESCAVLIIELKHFQQSYLKAKKARASKEFYTVLNSLRNTLNQLPRTKPKVRGGESGLDLGSIINGQSTPIQTTDFAGAGRRDPSPEVLSGSGTGPGTQEEIKHKRGCIAKMARRG